MKNRVLQFLVTEIFVAVAIILFANIYWISNPFFSNASIGLTLKLVLAKAHIYLLVPILLYIVIEFLAKKSATLFNLKQLLLFITISIGATIGLVLSYEGTFYQSTIYIEGQPLTNTQEQPLSDFIFIFLIIASTIHFLTFSTGRFLIKNKAHL